jgi:glycosyltransferase involved in cell wall biosynthesis
MKKKSPYFDRKNPRAPCARTEAGNLSPGNASPVDSSAGHGPSENIAAAGPSAPRKTGRKKGGAPLESKRICLLNDSFPPQLDGVANAVVNYASILQRAGTEIAVGIPEYPGVEDHYSFPVVRYPSINTTEWLGYRAGYPFTMEPVQTLRNFRPDLIHCHCPVMSMVMARTLRELTGKPIVLTYHTKFDIDVGRAVRSEFLQKEALRMLCNNIEAADEVWTVSRGAGENMRKLGYQGDYIIMENGVDFPKGRVPDAELRKLDAEYGLDPQKPLFLFVGRMMWYKGIRIILDALKMQKEKGLAFTAAFIGSGLNLEEIVAYRDSLGLQAECLFPGAVQDRELLRAWYCRADLFLFPSTFDTNGIVVREAAACGLPSALVRGSCAAEGIMDGQNGLLIDENAESLAAVIGEACKHPEALRRIGENAAAQLYISWEDAVARAADRYDYLIEKYKDGIPDRPSLKFDGMFTALGGLIGGMSKVREESARFRLKYRQHHFPFRGRYL